MAGVHHTGGYRLRHEPENDTFSNVTDNPLVEKQPKWKINHGFEGEDQTHYKYTNQTEWDQFSNGNVDLGSKSTNQSSGNWSLSSMSLDRSTERSTTSARSRNDVSSYYGDNKYFVDDNEETKTLTIDGNDNWLLRDHSHNIQESNHTRGPYNNVNESSTRSLGTFDHKGMFPGVYESPSNLHNQRSRSEQVLPAYISGRHHEQFSKRLQNYQQDIGDKNLHDVTSGLDTTTVAADGNDDSGLVDEDVHTDDVKEALEGFDYLDKLDEHDNDSDDGHDNDSDDGVKEALRSFNYLDEQIDVHHRQSVKEALGKFDYLDDIDVKSDITSSDARQSVKNETLSSHSAEHAEKIIAQDNEERVADIDKRENDRKQSLKNVSKLPNAVHEGNNSYNKREVDEDSFEFKNHKSLALPEVYLGNNEWRPDERDSHYNNDHRQKFHDTRTANLNELQEAHRRYGPDKLDARRPAMFDRTRSEEAVSGYSGGQFLLRKTQSEELDHSKPAVKHLAKPVFDVVPEDKQVNFTTPVGVGYTKREKRKSSSSDHKSCSVVLKVLAVILFGLAVAKLTLGFVFRDSCEVETIIPVCVIVSGGVALFYSVSFFGVDFTRKRFKKTPRALRAFLVLLWIILLGLIVTGCVLLYPNIKDFAFTGCSSEIECCRRKFILTAFSAIITDIISLIMFGAIICFMK